MNSYNSFLLKKKNPQKANLSWLPLQEIFSLLEGSYLPFLPGFRSCPLLLILGSLFNLELPALRAAHIQTWLSFDLLPPPLGFAGGFTCGDKDAKLVHVTMLWLPQ